MNEPIAPSRHFRIGRYKWTSYACGTAILLFLDVIVKARSPKITKSAWILFSSIFGNSARTLLRRSAVPLSGRPFLPGLVFYQAVQSRAPTKEYVAARRWECRAIAACPRPQMNCGVVISPIIRRASCPGDSSHNLSSAHGEKHWNACADAGSAGGTGCGQGNDLLAERPYSGSTSERFG
jgi:hypothetical protein